MKSLSSPAHGSPRRGARWAAAAALAAVLALAGCAAGTPDPSGSTDAAAAGGTLTIGATTDVGKLDPIWSNLPTYNQFAYATFVHQSASGEFSAYIANEWTFSDDAKSVTFTLRDDVKFSDGTALDAENSAASINRFLTTPSAKLAMFGGLMESVEATGENEVTVNFKVAVPQSYALGIFADSSIVSMIASPEGTANPDLLNTSTLGAGPYVLDAAQTTAGTVYTYVRNEHYFLPETVTYDTIVITPYADPNALSNAVTTGQVDYAVELLAPLAAAAQGAGLTISKGALGIGASGTSMLVFGDHTTGPVGDVKVRQAIAYAIDREAINEALYGGLATAQSSATPPGAGGYTGEDPYGYDIEKAKSLLAEAGYPDGFELTVVDPSAFDPGNLVGQAVKGALAEIGITVNLQQNDDPFTDTTMKLLGGEFPAYIYTEPGESVFNLVTGSMAGQGGGPINPHNEPLPDDVQAAFDAVSTVPAEEQEEALKDLTRAVDANQWSVTITSIPRFTVVGAGVQGVPADYVTAEPLPYSPIPGESWSGN